MKKLLFGLALLVGATFTNATAQNSVTMWQVDPQHTGANTHETMLRPGTVSSPGNFGLLFSQPTDGQIYGQPLVAAGVKVGGTTHNVVYVATQHDSLYAFDADTNTGGNAAPLWQASFIQPGVTQPVPQSLVSSGDISDELGITTTPVIDLAGSTIYVVSKIQVIADGTFHQYLHALDLATGAEKFSGPVEINPTFVGSSNFNKTEQTTPGVVPFNALREHLRCAMALNNGVVYLAYASHSDANPYHGEILGYNASNLQLVKTFIATPNGTGGGFWGGGASPAFDTAGNMFIPVANGAFDQTASPYTTATDWGETMLKLSTTGSLTVSYANTLNWFTPNIWKTLNNGDLDLGSSGLLLLPDQAGGSHTHLLVGGGKGGVMYVIDRDNMGGLSTPDNSVQQFTTPNNNYLFVTPAYFNGNIYYACGGCPLEQRTVGYNATTGNYISPTSVQSSRTFGGDKGSTCFITGNGNTNGIVWLLFGNGLIAYDATNVSQNPLISINATTENNVSCQNTKFSVPTVVNGKAYFTGYKEVAAGTNRSAGYLFVCGIFPSAVGTPTAPANASAAATTASSTTVTWTDTSSNETGFVVKRSTSAAGPFTQTGSTVGANVTVFTDSGLTAGTTYYYQVFAQNANGPSSASNVASATTFPVYSAPGLVAYWSLDDSASSGTAVDATGNGHTGTVHGEAVFADALINNGIELHGTGNATSNITVPNTASMQFTASQSFTLSAWVLPENLNGNEQAVLAKSADQGNKYGIWINTAGKYVFRGPGGDIVGGAAGTDEWDHVTVVQDGAAGTRKIYMNGVLAATGAAQAADGAGALWMGQQNAAALDSFPGQIDEVRLYNRALAASEITNLMSTPILEAVSSQKQGNAGTYGLIIAPSPTQVNEPREGSTTGSYNLVLNFSAPVSGIAATLGLQGGGSAVGQVGAITYDGTGKIVTVKLTGVGNHQALNLHLTGIDPSDGTADIPFNILWGDVNSDNVVNYLDASIVQNNQLPLVNSVNFVYDLDCDGAVTSADASLASAATGTQLGTQLDTNLALYQPAADLNSLSPNTAAMAFDNNQTLTRWESVHGVDPGWIEVDLGSVSTIHSIVLNWENAAGATYLLQSSNDNVNWTNLLPQISGNTSGGVKTYSGLNGTGRFVRMYGTTRTTPYGYSLLEFQVIGLPGSNAANFAPSITGDLSASGTQGQSLSYQVSATNSPTSYAATNLPAGMNINAGTGIISGSPTVSGTITTLVTATNAKGSSIATPILFTLASAGNTPVITSATTASGTVGTAFSYQIAATSSPTSFGASGLPAGLNINTTTGVISGTPAATGTSNVTITATNGSGTGTGGVSITIAAAAPQKPVISSAGTASGTVGSAFSYQISALNSPTSFGATGLPAGLSVNTTTGLISGTPTASGTTSVTIIASNAGGTGTGSVSITIAAAAPQKPVINSAATALGTVGVAFTYQISASNNPTSFSATGLPAGLGVDTTTGMISGTPTASGSFPVTLSAANASGSGTGSLALTINPASTSDVLLSQGQPAAASSVTANNTAGMAFDGNDGTRWESSHADPQWIYVDLNSVCTIHSIMLHWENAAGKSYELQVSNDLTNWTPLVTVTNNTTGGVLNYTGLNGSGRYVRMYGKTRTSAYGYSLWEFQVYGVAGTPIDTNVALNKTATATSFKAPNTAALAVDGNGGTRWESAYADPQSIQVDLGAVYNIDTIVLNWQNAAGKDYTLQVSNDNQAWTTVQTVTGNKSTGVLAYPGLATSGRYVKMAGTARTGTFGYSLWEFQVLGYPASGNAASITSAGTASGTVGSAFSYQITATNNPTSFTAANLPGGLSLNTSTGLISGTPSAAGGPTTVALTAGNGTTTATGSVAITINPAGSPPVINSAAVASGTIGAPFSYQITATNNPTGFNATNLPAGLSVNTTTGLISGTSTASGTTSVALSASNGSGSGTGSVSITINAGADTNLALNKTATASSFQPGNVAANGNDGNTTGTRWAAVDGTMPQTWTVDLGAVKTLSRVDIAWFTAATRSYQYKIAVSNDNAAYTTVVDKSSNTTFGNTSDGVAASARFVRITISKASAGWASAYEFQVFGH